MRLYCPPRLRVKSCVGFTLIEVMIAASVMVLVIMSSIGTLSFGYRLLENARLNTLAGQVLQSEMETLRLQNWTQISSLPATDTFAVEPTLASASKGKFSCTRKVESIRATTNKITLTVSWNGMQGEPHSRQYITFFGKDGLNDYYYRTF